MRVLLLNPPFLPGFLRSARCTFLPISGSNWYPIFLGYAAGWLSKHGHKIKLVDGPVAKLTAEQVYEIAKQFKPDMLVLYISQASLLNDMEIGGKIKDNCGCKLVVVGPWCAKDPVGLIKEFPQIDVVVRREFDDVLVDLASGKKKNNIKGIVYKEKGKAIFTGERPFLTSKQLDEFPFVTKIYKENLPIENYYQASLLHPWVDMFTARGCAWNQCTFCLWPNTIHKGASYRMRSLENVISELKYIKKELPEVREVFFQDDMLPTARARQLSELILKNNIKMNWSCYVKADMDFETLKLMKKSGARYVHVGYETVDPKIIKNIKKGTQKETMEKFTENTKKAGLRVHGDFILGLPGETPETIKATIEWAKNLNIEGYQVFIPQPHEATPLYDYLDKNKYLTREGDINYPNLSKNELSKWRFWALRKIYLSPRYIFQTLVNINSPAEFFRLFRTAVNVIPNILFPGKFY